MKNSTKVMFYLSFPLALVVGAYFAPFDWFYLVSASPPVLDFLSRGDSPEHKNLLANGKIADPRSVVEVKCGEQLMLSGEYALDTSKWNFSNTLVRKKGGKPRALFLISVVRRAHNSLGYGAVSLDVVHILPSPSTKARNWNSSFTAPKVTGEYLLCCQLISDASLQDLTNYDFKPSHDLVFARILRVDR